MENGYQPNLSIDRIEVNGNYSPDNCRWATKAQQVANTRHARNITFEGETYPLGVWARIKGIERATLSYRLRDGWPLSDALNTPAFLGQNHRPVR